MLLTFPAKQRISEIQKRRARQPLYGLLPVPMLRVSSPSERKPGKCPKFTNAAKPFLTQSPRVALGQKP